MIKYLSFLPEQKLRLALVLTTLAGLAACSSAPPPPDWQANSLGAIERSNAAYLEGNARVEAQEFSRAKSEISRTGRPDLMARVELMHCAARVASLVQDDCAGFEKLRQDAVAPERAYAAFLAGKATAQDVALLPAQHRTAAAASGDAATSQALQAIADPLSRLIAAGVLFRKGQANPAVIESAINTSSAQGWRRPLLAWLGVQLLRVEKAGNTAEAERLRRRIASVENMPPKAESAKP